MREKAGLSFGPHLGYAVLAGYRLHNGGRTC
jgi:hypothetical protein